MPKRNSSLDGVRALAIAAVIGYHADIVWLPGGFLGVEVFFVLSGYLIGGTLFNELEHNGRVDLTSYLRRRVRRLAPALLTMLAVIATIVVLKFPDQVGHLQRGAIGGMTGTGNWLELYRGGDYFAQFGRGPVLRHLWSFAVEVQAYLLLPFLIPFIWRCANRSRTFAAMLLGGLGLIAYVWQAIVALQPNGASRAYFGTDTRIGAILFGVALAAAQPERFARYVRRVPLATVGFLGLSGLGFAFTVVDGTDPKLYQGIFGLTAALTVLVVASSSSIRSNILSSLLKSPPLRWIGTRSYGLYLWHWPIFVLTRPIAGNPIPWPGFATRMAVCALLAEVSFRWIEGGTFREPIWKLSQFGQLLRTRRRVTVMATVSLSAVLCLGLSAAAPAGLSSSDSIETPTVPPRSIAQPTTTSLALTSDPAIDPTIDPTIVTNGLPGTTSLPDTTAPVTTSLPASSTSPVASTRLDTTLAPSILSTDLTLIGDSVMQVTKRSLDARLGVGYVLDTEVGRQFPAAIDRVIDLRAQGRLNPIVIIGLGTNGPFTDKDIDALIVELSDRRVVAFVKVEVPRRWKKRVNTALDRAKERHPEIVLIDWPGLVADQGLTLSDGVHPAPKAAVAYTDLLLRSVSQ